MARIVASGHFAVELQEWPVVAAVVVHPVAAMQQCRAALLAVSPDRLRFAAHLFVLVARQAALSSLRYQKAIVLLAAGVLAGSGTPIVRFATLEQNSAG